MATGCQWCKTEAIEKFNWCKDSYDRGYTKHEKYCPFKQLKEKVAKEYLIEVYGKK